MLSVCFSFAFVRILFFQCLTRTATFSPSFAPLLRKFLNSAELLGQTRVVYAAPFLAEELSDEGGNDPVELLGRAAHPAHDPRGVVRDGTSRSAPAQAQEAKICAVLFNAEMGRIRLVVRDV